MDSEKPLFPLIISKPTNKNGSYKFGPPSSIIESSALLPRNEEIKGHRQMTFERSALLPRNEENNTEICNEEIINGIIIPQPTETRKKIISGTIDVIDDYCDRFSTLSLSVPRSPPIPTSAPIDIPKKNQKRIYKYGTYTGDTKITLSGNPPHSHENSNSNSFTDSIYKYITSSIDNLRNHLRV